MFHLHISYQDPKLQFDLLRDNKLNGVRARLTMNRKVHTTMRAKRVGRNLLAIFCVLLTVPFSLPAQEQTTSSQPTAAKIPADQLDSLVAPIALYPDPLLAQTLAASTYPLEVVQLQQWLAKNPNLKDKELADAAGKQDWDPTIQAMAGLPDVVKRLADDIQWTTDLGNAFLAQQSDVMDAVQRMRKKAQDKGNLKSGNEVKIETKVVESKEIIIVEQANPQVVYVPSYNPTVVYGAPVYAYPPIYYPPAGYYAAGMAVSFGVGVAMGAMWGGGWGWGCGWGNNDIDINVNNNFNRNANINRNTNVNRSGNVNRGANSGKWSHNSQHRGGTPYSSRSTASKYGGNARGDSLSSRQSSARQQVNRQSGNMQSSSRSSNRSPSGSNYRSSGSSSRSNYNPSASSNRSSGSNYRSSGSSSYGGSSDRVGSRDMSRSSGSSGSRSAMGSGSRGSYSGSSARSSSSRGSRSMGGSRGGGGRRR